MSIIYLCQTKKCCDDLLLQLDADSLNHAYMAKIKYVCEKVGAGYYHKKILKQVTSLVTISELGDLPLVATKLNCTVSALNNTPGILYGNFDSDYTKSRVAINLGHIQGINYLYKYNSTTTLYDSIDSIYSSIAEKFLAIIQCKDLEAFQNVLSTDASIFNKLDSSYLSAAYQYESFEIATELIKHGIKFNIKYIMNIYPSVPYSEYIEHIKNLKLQGLIDDEMLYMSKALINAMFWYDKNMVNIIHINPLLSLLHSNCSFFNKDINFTCDKVTKFIIHETCLADCTSYFLEKIMGIHYNEVTRPIFSVMFAIHYPHTILLSFKGILPPFCGPLNQYYKVYGGYIGDAHFLPKLIHELTHAFLYAVFQNDSKPYPKHQLGGTSIAYEAYKKAKTLFLENVFKELKIVKNGISDNEELEDILANNMYLNIHGYCLNKNNKLLTIILGKYALKDWSIENLLTTEILDELVENRLGGKSVLKKLIDIENRIREKANITDFIKAIKSEFNLDIGECKNIMYQYLEIKKEMEKTTKDFCTKQTLDSEYSIFLYRLFDYVKRDKIKWDAELLPRFAEIYLDKNGNVATKELYKPLLQYWTEYVIPEANKVISADYAYQNNVFVEKQAGLLSYMCNYFFVSEKSEQTIGDILNNAEMIWEI